MSSSTIITYGTFDLFHIGHLRLLERAKNLGDKLIVAVSTDEFNSLKNKRSFMPFEHRSQIVSSIKCVDMVIPESSWDQKVNDIKKYNVDIFCMGDDWFGKFDDLKEYCDVKYFPRTQGVDSTSIRELARVFDKKFIEKLTEVQIIVDELMIQIKGE
jgi:glycerol-3-phosphate cytidylyltransferase